MRRGLPPVNDVARWTRTAKHAPNWDARNRLIASWIPAGSSVLDLGAGAQTLHRYLPAGCRYTPADLVAGPGVVPTDLNAQRLPDVERHDIVVCSGVLEYLRNLRWVVPRLPALGRRAILSYADRRPGANMALRRGYGWVNHLPRERVAVLVDAVADHWEVRGHWRDQMLIAADFTGAAALPPLRDGREARWQRHLHALAAFAAHEGHPRVPPGHREEGVDLGAWAARQRSLYRAGQLKPHRAAELEYMVRGWT